MRAEAPAFAPAVTAAEPGRSPSNRSAWRKAGWISAGMLAAGAAGVALWARDESRVLRDARDHFPGDADRVRRLSDKTLSLSVIADSLGAAAVVVGAITLYASVGAKEGAPSTRVSAGLGSMTLQLTF